MTTFQELQEKLTKTKHRKALVEYMINHFDTEFRATAVGDGATVIATLHGYLAAHARATPTA